MAAETEEKIIRRNRPGTKAKDFYSWPPQDFNDMDTILAVQQYIQYMIRKDHTDVDAILEPPETHDDLAVWKYEHLRQFCLELNLMAVRLQNECDPAICSKMKATEQWIFLCAAHGEPKECSALDYTLHTLHGTSCLLNSNKHFDSRVTIRDSSAQKLGSIARRLYRIFSHTHFHHQQLFSEFEAETSLCLRFTRFVKKYGLMSQENLIVPIDGAPSAEIVLTEQKEEKESEESEA